MLKNIAIRIIKMLLGIIFISMGMTFILKAGLGQSTMADAYRKLKKYKYLDNPIRIVLALKQLNQ